jgi:hypothetical protein
MPEQNGSAPRGYLLFVWSPTGYTLRELEGEPPRLGDEIEDGERSLLVSKVGLSPFPRDTRVCLYSMGKP